MDFVITREQVYALTDDELVVAAHLIQLKDGALKLELTPWEKQFCAGVVEHYRTAAVISWKQRKSLREILIRISSLLLHRAEIDARLKQAEAAAAV